MMKWIMKGSCKDRWIRIVDYDVDYVGLCKSMDHRDSMAEICKIMDGRWVDVDM